MIDMGNLIKLEKILKIYFNVVFKYIEKNEKKMWGGLWCSSWILAGGLRPPDPTPGWLRPPGPPEVWLSYATVWGLRTGGGLE